MLEQIAVSTLYIEHWFNGCVYMWLYLALEPEWAGETELPVQLPKGTRARSLCVAVTPGAIFVCVVLTYLFILVVISSEQFKANFAGAAAKKAFAAVFHFSTCTWHFNGRLNIL